LGAAPLVPPRRTIAWSKRTDAADIIIVSRIGCRDLFAEIQQSVRRKHRRDPKRCDAKPSQAKPVQAHGH